MTHHQRPSAPSGDGGADPASDVVNGLRRIVRALELYSHEVRKSFGLTGPQLWALKTLHRRGSLAIGELAEALAVEPSSLSLLLDRLEQRRLVRRVRSRDDRRFVDVGLTAAGSRAAARAPEPAQGRLLHGLRALRPKQLAALARAVRTLAAMMEATDVEAPFFFEAESARRSRRAGARNRPAASSPKRR
jgi:DNA-binding MarR family transcriptional regulator